MKVLPSLDMTQRLDRATYERRLVAGQNRLYQLRLTLGGFMGTGKSTVGRRLARRLKLPFVDADSEIETAAAMTVSEIFERFGVREVQATTPGQLDLAPGRGHGVEDLHGEAFVGQDFRRRQTRPAR